MKRIIAFALAGTMLLGPAWSESLTGPIGGGGGGGGSGTVTSLTATCGLAATPSPITTTGSYGASTTVNPQTGANYPIVSGDCGKLVNLSNASPQIPTIPSGATLGAGWATEVCNQGAGTQTITPASGTIGGAATYVLAAGTAAAPKCAGIVSDGTNLQIDLVGSGGSVTPAGTSGQLQTNNGSGGLGAANLADAFFPTYVTGLWYVPYSSTAANTSSGALAATTAYCTLGLIGGSPSVTIKSLSVRIATSGSTNVQLAIYNNSSTAAGYEPGTLVINSASVANTAGSGNTTNVSITPTALTAGFYWFCVQSNDTTFRMTTVGGLSGSWAQGGNNAGGVINLNGTVSTSTGIASFGTWPSFVGATFANAGGSGPLMAFQVN
jgi:hypothetical protein